MPRFSQRRAAASGPPRRFQQPSLTRRVLRRPWQPSSWEQQPLGGAYAAYSPDNDDMRADSSGRTSGVKRVAGRRSGVPAAPAPRFDRTEHPVEAEFDQDDGGAGTGAAPAVLPRAARSGILRQVDAFVTSLPLDGGRLSKAACFILAGGLAQGDERLRPLAARCRRHSFGGCSTAGTPQPAPKPGCPPLFVCRPR